MAKYRKKPVVIEAWRIKASEADGDLAYAVVEDRLKYCEDGSVLIRTLEGDMQGFVGDWIIRGVKGELYPCRNDIFDATYEPVQDEKTDVMATNETIERPSDADFAAVRTAMDRGAYGGSDLRVLRDLLSRPPVEVPEDVAEWAATVRRLPGEVRLGADAAAEWILSLASPPAPEPPKPQAVWQEGTDNQQNTTHFLEVDGQLAKTLYPYYRGNAVHWSLRSRTGVIEAHFADLAAAKRRAEELAGVTTAADPDGPSHEWLARMGAIEDEHGGAPSVGGLAADMGMPCTPSPAPQPVLTGPGVYRDSGGAGWRIVGRDGNGWYAETPDGVRSERRFADDGTSRDWPTTKLTERVADLSAWNLPRGCAALAVQLDVMLAAEERSPAPQPAPVVLPEPDMCGDFRFPDGSRVDATWTARRPDGTRIGGNTKFISPTLAAEALRDAGFGPGATTNGGAT